MRIALACSVVTHCASFSHECSVSRLHIKLGFWWLLPPEMTSEYRTYGHMIHACTHWIIWGKYGASWTTFRGRTATRQLPVTVVHPLAAIQWHQCFSDTLSWSLR